MAGYLLDTNVIGNAQNPGRSWCSRLSNGGRRGRAVPERSHPGELRKGVAAGRRIDTAAADRLGMWVDDIETTFADRVLPVDMPVARIWAELSARRSLPVIDTLIAATAMAHELTLVTRNTREVEATGIPLVDPWQA